MDKIEEKIKSTALKANIYINTLEEVVEFLQNQLLKGKNVYYEFNGHKLYSLLDDIDSCFLKVTGKTYEQYQKAQEEWRKEYQEEERRAAEEAEKKVPTWIERGNAIISKELQEEWARCVKIRSEDLYHGMELDAALDIMELLAKGGSCKDAYTMLDEQNHSGMSASITRSIINTFSSRGNEFIDYGYEQDKERE